jgi:hypothetical protein
MEKGVIVDLKSIKDWPIDGQGKSKRFLGHYCREQQVEELIAFFRDSWVVRMLNAIDSDIDGIGLLKKINIEKACAAEWKAYKRGNKENEMNGYNIAALVILVLELGIAMGKHGEDRPPINFLSTLFSTAIWIALLIKGGFFN